MDNRIQYCIDAELNFARAKFPGSNLNFAALVEEVGELSNALLDHSYGKKTPEQVFAEAIQVAVMAIRVAQEGSAEFPYKFEHSHYQKFDVNKSANKPKEPKKFIFSGKPKNQISAEFLRRFQSAGCQCGKQKLENYPLCGLCFSRLTADLKTILRRAKGAELEEAYEFAVKTLREAKR